MSIHRPRSVRLRSESDSDKAQQAAETKIYAISSEGGNVIYHVSNQGTSKPASKRSSEELRTFALTTMTDSGSATQKSASKVGDEMHFEKVGAHGCLLNYIVCSLLLN